MRKGVLFFVIVACGWHVGKGAKGKTALNDSKIYFPDNISVDNRYGNDDVPPECKGKNYCTIKPANYPQERYNQLFNNTIILDGPQFITDSVITLEDKIGEYAGDGCEAYTTFEPIFRVRSKRGDWHTVIQAPDKNYLQKVRLESCREEDAPCFQGIGYGSEIVTGCKQKYSEWDFVVDDDKGGLTKKRVQLPVCCSCHYEINFAN